jgi:ATP-dependent DNA ligase
VLRGRRSEIKHDGFRIPAIRNRGPALLLTRKDYDISKRLRHITAALTALPAERFVLAEAWGAIRTGNPFTSCRSTNSSFLALLLGCIVFSLLQLA